MTKTRRHHFEAVRSALHKHWGLALHRGGALTDLGRDGRWDATYSKTGYVVGGQFPRGGYGYRHYRSLASVVEIFELEKLLAS